MASRRSKTTGSTADLIAEECLSVRTRLLNRTISGIYDEALRPIGMTAGQLNILVAVGKRGPIGQTEIGHRLNMEKSTLSRNIERMRRNRWLTAAPAATGRGRMLRVTAAGRRQLERALPLWRQAQQTTMAMLGQRGTKALRSVADGVWARMVHE